MSKDQQAQLDQLDKQVRRGRDLLEELVQQERVVRGRLVQLDKERLVLLDLLDTGRQDQPGQSELPGLQDQLDTQDQPGRQEQLEPLLQLPGRQDGRGRQVIPGRQDQPAQHQPSLDQPGLKALLDRLEPRASQGQPGQRVLVETGQLDRLERRLRSGDLLARLARQDMQDRLAQQDFKVTHQL